MNMHYIDPLRWWGRVILLVSVILLWWHPARAEALTLKMASSAPQNSVWGRVLESIADDFRSITGGEVTVRIFHNGIAGSETDVLRKVQLGQLDIAVLTSAGLGSINDSVLTLSVPGLIATADEFDHVLNKFGDSLQQEINKGRYELLGWAGVAWLYAFSSKPFRLPADLQRVQLATSNGSENLTQFFRDAGYNPVPLAFSEWLTGLNSGLVDGFFASPIATAGFQWFGIANNMVNVRLAPFLGSVVIGDRSWKKIDSKYHTRLRAATQRRLQDLTKESFELEMTAINTMQRFGLNVITLTASEKDAWADSFDINRIIRQGGRRAEIVRNLFDFDLYSSIRSELVRYRRDRDN